MCSQKQIAGINVKAICDWNKKPTMTRFLPSRLLAVLCVLMATTTTCHAFTVFGSTPAAKATTSYHYTKLMVTPLRENDRSSVTDQTSATPPHHDVRQWFTNHIMAVFMVSSIGSSMLLLAAPPSASASYSAYAHREEDWQQRVSQNTIQVSSPKLLRDQLRQIAPMNEERSRIFCPNGPSAAVTPLMENRCSDVRQATPSVFGRSDDAVGNSIPGFSKEWTSSIYSSSATADPGGLPEYGFTKSSRK